MEGGGGGSRDCQRDLGSAVRTPLNTIQCTYLQYYVHV